MYELIIRATEQCIPDEDQVNVEFNPDDDTLLKVNRRLLVYNFQVSPSTDECK